MKKSGFISEHMRGYRLKLVLVILATLISSFLGLFQTYMFSYVVDNVIDGKPMRFRWLETLTELLGGMEKIRSALYIVAIFLICCYAVRSLLLHYRFKNQAEVAEGFCENIRNDLYDHIQHLPYSYHVRIKTGDLIQRCTSDVDTIRRFFSGQIEEIFAIVFSVVIAVSIMVSLNLKLSLFAGISFPIIFLYSFIFFKKIRKLFLASDEKEAEMTSFIQESLSGVRVIKAFNRERYELDRFLGYNKNYKDTTYGMLTNLGVYWGLSYFLCTIGILSVVATGVFYVRAGELSVGNYLVFITYQGSILYQIRQLGRILSDFGKVSVSLDRLLEIKKEIPENLEEGLTPSLEGDIVFDDVSFHYDDDPDCEILRHLSFTIPQGKTVAVIGPTGSGKSSMVHLLSRLYDVSSGQILINGTDINEIAKGHLRKNIGIVLQEPFLFSKSIYENLKISNPSLDEQTIYHASQIASIHEVIKSFDKGYDTIVGEKGVTLSGGQKQRIAIARTIVNKLPILIFDDSLSAVDTETDAEIRKALHSFDKEATTIIITQRILSAKDADMILVLENGEITQMGTHEQLLKEDGLYKRIADIQGQKKGEDDEQ